jgi:hypothetical protein
MAISQGALRAVHRLLKQQGTSPQEFKGRFANLPPEMNTGFGPVGFLQQAASPQAQQQLQAQQQPQAEVTPQQDITAPQGVFNSGAFSDRLTPGNQAGLQADFRTLGAFPNVFFPQQRSAPINQAGLQADFRTLGAFPNAFFPQRRIVPINQFAPQSVPLFNTEVVA